MIKNSKQIFYITLNRATYIRQYISELDPKCTTSAPPTMKDGDIKLTDHKYINILLST